MSLNIFDKYSDSLSILIIDDNEGDQLLLKEELLSTDLPIAGIAMAASLKQARQHIIQTEFSLIFLDLFLPDSLGLDSFIGIQKINPVIPIIIYSGFADKKAALKAISLGAQDFLIKGVHSVELLEKTITYSIERKRNLETIKLNNEQYETLLKVTNDILWDWNLITGKVSWSGTGITKYLPVNTYGERVSTYFWLRGLHRDERKNVVTGIYKAIDAGQNFWQSEFRFLRNDGQYDYMYSRGYILCSEENTPVRMIGSMQDITERKVADQKLAISEKRFKALIQNSTDLIVLINKHGNYLYISDSAFNILGYEPASCLGNNVFSLIYPNDIQLIKEALSNLADNAFIELPAFRFKNMQGEWRWLKSTLINKLNDKALEGIIVNSRDITNRILAEQQLAEANATRHKEVTEAMIEGQENERTEIGRELHDNVNQLLVATKLYIEMGMKKEDGGQVFLSGAVSYAMQAIEEIRKLSKTLITPLIKDIGLIESVQFLAEDIMHVNSVVIKLETDRFKQQELSEKFKLNIFRIVQEQVNNILKHARAKQIDILFQQTASRVYIAVNDDGIGFDTSKRINGIGISNILSRAALYKGNVVIASSPGSGCSMSIVFNELDLLSEHPELSEIINV